MMVTHTRLQQYKHHYGMVFLTGLFGCRWHRYQQSTEKTEKVDLVWFAFLILTSGFILLWFYFWLIAENNFNDIEWYLYQHVQSYVPVYTILLILTCITLAYIAILITLALCHIGHGHQIYLHHVHKALLAIMLTFCALTAVLITELWRSGWHLQLRSLMITAPFLHVVALAILTFLSWFIASNSLELESKACQVICLGTFFALLIALYIAPLFIQSPCIGQMEDLPRKPAVVAHRGASAIAPENTYIAFKYAADYHVLTFESDVLISYDGIPFLLHDSTLRRTTNVDDVFPDRAHEPASMFNMSDLKQLDAGSKFLENDPQRTVSHLTDAQKAVYRNQTIMTLQELLEVANASDANVMFDIKFMDDLAGSVITHHPYNATYGDVIIQTILDSGIEQSKIWWLFGDQFNTTQNFTRVAGLQRLPTDMRDFVESQGISIVNVEYTVASWEGVRTFQSLNLSTNVYVVNSPWLFSLYWCMGVDSITSNHAETWTTVSRPVWHMTTTEFRIMWILSDCFSVIIVVVVFIIQGCRRNKRFKEEELSIQTARMKYAQRKQKQNMKVKLIHAAEGMTTEEDVDRGVPAINAATQGGGDGPAPPAAVAAPAYHTVSMSGDAMSGDASFPSADSAPCVVAFANPRTASSTAAAPTPTTSPTTATTPATATTSDSLNRTLSEDEVRGIRLAEITVDANA